MAAIFLVVGTLKKLVSEVECYAKLFTLLVKREVSGYVFPKLGVEFIGGLIANFNGAFFNKVTE